eukprot:m.141773 g.141773  ORF g.141773 m.141773 type:complete len:1199 (-) comp14042_c0_seq10:362-3958(-)
MLPTRALAQRAPAPYVPPPSTSIGIKTFECDQSTEECISEMTKVSEIISLRESVMNWKPPTTFGTARVCLDRCHLGLLVHATQSQYIPLRRISDVRAVPYVDEYLDGMHPLITQKELPVLVNVVYYTGECDFVNVHFLQCLFETKEMAQAWRVGLQSLVSNNILNNPRDISIAERELWLHAEALSHFDEKTDTISLQDLVATISPQCEGQVRSFMQAYPDLLAEDDRIPCEKLTPQIFQDLIMHIYHQEDVVIALSKQFPDAVHVTEDSTASLGSHISHTQLTTLLASTQRDPRLNEILLPIPSEVDSLTVIAEFETDPALREQKRISFRSLNRFLMSANQDGFDHAHRSLYMDMSKPLSHYYIASSHNTYLTGGQFQSKSTAEIYRQVLLAGCRCVEIDIWDGADEEPEVTHGLTMCTRIPFVTVIKAIAESAFINSPYPVILSFENHCSPNQMRKMAEYCTEVFGSNLLKTFLPGDESPVQLPSPEKLKYKIIIKNKKRKADGTTLGEEDLGQAEVVEINGEVVCEDDDELQRRRERSKEIVSELSNLVNYCTPYHFKSFKDSRAQGNCTYMSSFVEKRGIKLMTVAPQDFIDYNKTQQSRIYPNGTRLNSANYNPQLFWNVGCQMVALNYQVMDAPMQLNMGKFEQNGRSGYLLKPTLYTNPQRTFNPFDILPIDDVVPLSFRMKALGVRGLKSSKGAPYVEIQLYGIPADGKKRRLRTRAARGRGFNPRWQTQNELVAERLILPQLVLVRLAVYDAKDSDRCLGYTIAPLDSLRPGYRYLHLKGAASPFAAVFTKIDIEIYVDSEHADFVDRLINPMKAMSLCAQRMEALEELLDPEQDDEQQETQLSLLQSVSPCSLMAPPSPLAISSTRTSASDLSGLQPPLTPTEISRGSSVAGSKRSKIQAAVDQFSKSISDHVRETRPTLEERTKRITGDKRIQTMKQKLEKQQDAKEIARAKKIAKATAEFQKKVTKLFSQLNKQKKTVDRKRSKLGDDAYHTQLVEIQDRGIHSLLDLELEFTEALHTLHIHHLRATQYELTKSHHESVTAEILKYLETEHDADRKMLDKHINLQWRKADKLFRKKDQELWEEYEKKMQQVAVNFSMELRSFARQDMEFMSTRLETKVNELEELHKLKLEEEKKRMEERRSHLSSLRECPDQRAIVSQLSVSQYWQHLEAEGRLNDAVQPSPKTKSP